MPDDLALSHEHTSRRRFIKGLGVAAAAGAAGTALGPAAPAMASGGGSSVFPRQPAPKPITQTIPTAEPGFDPPKPFDVIHWLLPGPDGATTQILNLPAFGLDVDPSTIGDFKGFVTYAVLAGKGRDAEGTKYDVELDVRVMKGRYIAEDGKKRRGTFGFF